jgi:U3 small nucleolar RNA-associated protein 10
VVTEAIAAKLERARSGRSNIQTHGEEEVVRGILPTLSEGLSMRKTPQLQMGCYMIVTVLVSKTRTSDVLLSSLMAKVVSGWTQTTRSAGLVCLAVIAQRRSDIGLPGPVTKQLLRDESLVQEILSLRSKYRIEKLLFQLALGVFPAKEKIQIKVVQEILQKSILDAAQTRTIIYTALEQGKQLTSADSTEMDADHVAQYSEFLRELLASPRHQEIAGMLIEESDVDMDLLEMKLQMAIMPLQEPERHDEDESMEDIGGPIASMEIFDNIISNIPTRPVDEVSFLASTKSTLFEQLVHVFLKAVSMKEVHRFESLPILKEDRAFLDPLFFSFFARVWCGPFPVLVRSAALQSVTRKIELAESSSADLQGLVPYILNALADSSETVRRAAAGTALAVTKYQKHLPQDIQEASRPAIWAENDLYDEKGDESLVEWIRNVPDMARFLDLVLCPTIEECILDSNRIFSLVDTSLRGSVGREGGVENAKTKLKGSLRGSLLLFLASHTLSTPIWLVKLNLLKMVNRVEKAGEMNRTKALLPVLQKWTETSQEEIDSRSAAEKLDAGDLEAEMIGIVSSQKDGLQLLQSIISNFTNQRGTLIIAALLQIQHLWSGLKLDRKIQMSRFLLDFGLPVRNDIKGEAYRTEALTILRTIELPLEVLSDIISQIPKASALKGHGRPSKKRKIADLNGIAEDDNLALEYALRKLNVILELVDGSRPERYPALLSDLFRILDELQQYKSTASSELAYLQEMVLSNMLAILKTIQVSLLPQLWILD